MSGPRARLFLALDLPEPARASLVAWRDTLVSGRSDLRPVRPESLHVTLVFLGWQDESAVSKIVDAAFSSLSVGSPPRLTPMGVRSLPPRNPRLIALDLEDEGGRATALQAAASAALEAGGWYRPEKRPSGRISRSPARNAASGACSRSWTGRRRPVTFDAPVVTLYRSTLRPQGALYEPLARTLAVDAGDTAPQPSAD